MTINDSVISEQGMCEEEQVARIAWFYYHDGLTQSEISDSEFGADIARANNLGVINVLTGFKFIGQKICFRSLICI